MPLSDTDHAIPYSHEFWRSNWNTMSIKEKSEGVAGTGPSWQCFNATIYCSDPTKHYPLSEGCRTVISVGAQM